MAGTSPLAFRWSRARLGLLGAASVIALTSLQLVRQSGTPSWESVWAEDGAVYGREAIAVPLWRTFFRGYGGYVQLVPRLIASLARVVGVDGIAAAFACGAALLTAVLAVFVFRCTAGWIDDVWLRGVVAAMSALVPVAYVEASTNIANLGWPLLVAASWAIVSRQRQTTDTVLRAVVLAATALSTTVAALLAPAAFLVAMRRRERREWIVFGSFAVALALQLVLDRTAQASPPYHLTSSVGDLLEVFGVRVIGGTVIGERWIGAAWDAWHYGVAAVGIGALVAVGIVCRGAGRDRWALSLAALVAAFAMFAVPVWIRGSEAMRLHDSGLRPDGARYLVAPAVLMVSAIVVLVDGARKAWLRWLVVAHAIVLIAVSFQVANPRSRSTSWDMVVDRARVECQAETGDTTVRLAVTPPPLVLPVRCDDLR